MAKTKISEFSSTPSNNTDIDSINIAEGCAPSGINDAIRELMAQLKDWQSGTSNDPYVVGSSGSLTLNQGTANGIPYLNGSKVVTSGSALTFDGSTLATTGALTVDGNTTLGNASTDTVTVNGYMGIGGAGSAAAAIRIDSNALSGTSQDSILAYHTGTSGATANIRGVVTSVNTAAAAYTVTNVAGFWAANAGKGSGSTITNQHGLYIADQTQGTNNYGITSAVSSGTNKWNIYASGTAANYFAGNVGIGTSSPSTKLHLLTASATAVALRAGNSVSYAEFQVDSSGNSQLVAPGGVQIFNTNGAERMRIDSSGNVGIGTSSPQSTLHASAILSAGTVVNVGTFGQNSGSNPTVGQGARITLSSTNNASRAAAIQGVHESATNAHYLGFLTSANGADPTERMRIDSAGNMGLGVTPSAWASNFKANQIGQGAYIAGRTDAVALYMGSNGFWNGSSDRYIANGFATDYYQATGQHIWRTAASGTAGNAISFTQAMTLDASGRLVVGATSTAAKFQVSGASANTYMLIDNAAGGENYFAANVSNIFQTAGAERMRIDSSGNLLVGKTTTATTTQGIQIASNGEIFISRIPSDQTLRFYNASTGAQVGNITVSASATAYNTSSDYRLKNTIAPMTGALAKVAALKPCTYKWNADDSDGEGFIAHELAEVVPQAVSGEKDAVNEDGSINPQSIDSSFLIATLTAAIQEQQAIITALTARVEALESN